MNNGNPFMRHKGNGGSKPQTPQPQINLDPKFQVVCECGGSAFIPHMTFFRVPSQVIGAHDITVQQANVCQQCGNAINIIEAKLRGEVEGKQDSIPSQA